MSPYVWLGVAVVMAIVEAFSLSLITIWFVVGGIVAFVAGLAGVSLPVQIVVFLVVSVLCLVLLRPFIMKHRAIGESLESTQIGREAVVVEPIEGAGIGRVRTSDNMTWTALSVHGDSIEAGAEVRVVDQESIKLVVERI